MKSDALAVVVVRLQVPELHAGHRYLLDAVTTIHERVLVVIGETEARLTVADPLTFEMRRDMLHEMYPGVEIDRLSDHPSDEEWSQTLDGLICGYDRNLDTAVLYGGRDSFLKHYTGLCRTIELPPVGEAESSGTAVRAAVEYEDSAAFRRGVIYASKHKYPISYQCVDAVITRPDGQILLGQKKVDNGLWRFPGGFVSPEDATLEDAVRREVFEETGLNIATTHYIGSARINDFRYPKHAGDRLLSALFFTSVEGSSMARPYDDLDDCQWFEVTNVNDHMIPEHRVLYDRYTQFLRIGV